MKNRDAASVSTKKLTIQYSLIMGFYWASVFCVTGFASEFLLSRDFTSTRIGVILAIGNILAVILQPAIASIADRSQKIKVHHLVIVLTGLMILSFGALLFTGKSFFAIASLFVLSVTLLQILQPLTNSISVYYVNRGLQLNFGPPRAIGSTLYGILSFTVGFLVEKFSPSFDIYAGLCMMVLLLGTTLLMPILKDNAQNEGTAAAKEKVKEADKKSSNFLKKYPVFLLSLVGFVLIFMFHQYINCYLIQILQPLGGDSQIKGIAIGIQALVELPPMFLFAKLSKRFGSRKLLIFGSVFFALKAILLPFIGAAWQIYPIMVLQALSYAIYIPASVEYVNEVMEEEDKYKGQAIMVSSNTLGGTFGTLLGGSLIDAIQVNHTNIVFAGVCTLGAVVTILSMLIRTDRKKKAGENG